MKTANSISVIVPVLNSPDALRACLDNLFRFTTVPCRLILVADANDDQRVKRILQSASQRENVVVLANERALGFSGAINRGIEHAGRDDVLLLHSDSRVTPRWLEGMLAACGADPRAGTVTPLSDQAGMFSAPEARKSNPLPPGTAEDDYAAAVRRRACGYYPCAPAGHGFCIYIRRALLDAVGMLDAQAFPHDPAAVDDLCIRAARAGWLHMVDDRTYVFHGRSGSDGQETAAPGAAGMAAIARRYPEHAENVRVFSSDLRLDAARMLTRWARADCEPPRQVKPAALFVISTTTGGAPQANRDLMDALSDSWDAWLLQCRDVRMFFYKAGKSGLQTLASHTLARPVDLVTHRSEEYDEVVRRWLSSVNFDLVHIRHLLWHSLSLPQIAREHGAAVVMSFHDYYAACPTVNCVDNMEEFCGGTCTRSNGDCAYPALWSVDAFPPLKNNGAHRWRKNFSEALACCDAFITTSPSVRDALLAALPNLPADRFHCIPHGRDFSSFMRLGHAPEPAERLRVLVPGNINVQKGRHVITSLLDADTEQRLEFHVLGALSSGREHPRLKLHGTYRRENFAERVREIAPHIGAVFSICNETWCHTLTELWSVGLPAMVFDFPTVAGRVRESGGGWVYSHRDISRLYADIVRDGFDQGQLAEKRRAIAAWQEGTGSFSTTRLMAARYHMVYRAAVERRTSEAEFFNKGPYASEKPPRCYAPEDMVAVVCSSHKRQAQGSAYIRTLERTRNTLAGAHVFYRLSDKELLHAVRHGEIRAAVIQRNHLSAEVWSELRPYAASGRLRYLLDLDDDLLAVPQDKDAQNYESYRPTLTEIIQQADMVLVSTERLRQRIAGLTARVSLLPNALSRRIWAGDLPQRECDKVFRVLYMGSRTHDGDLRMLMPALEKVAARRPEFRLRLIGVLGKRLASQPDWMEHVDIPDWAEEYPLFIHWLKQQASSCACGVAPLENTAFNAVKSPLKVFDYAGLALPVLASDVEAYRELRDEAPHMVLVKNEPSAWERALLDLFNRRESLPAQGREMREWVLREHTLDSQATAFDNHVARLLGK